LDCLSGTVGRSKGRMYWGCFSWYGLGPIVALKSSVTGDSYVKILRGYVLPGLKKFPSSNDRGRPIFQQDNARPHTADVAKAFMAKNRIRWMDWPPQSPDLNPIENMWSMVKRSLRRKPNPGNLKELDALVKKAWIDVPPEYYHRLITSMPDRVVACINAGGGPIKH